MSSRTRVVALVAACLVALPAMAIGAPKQMGARNKPTLSGPLSTQADLQRCRKKKQKTEQGELVAQFHICNGYYVFDPDAETDPANDYGVYWVQGTVDSVNGWCTTLARTDLAGGSDGITARAPKPGTKVTPNKTKKFTTKLTVDAQGAAATDGIIKNTFRVLPGKMTSSVIKNGALRLQWTGITDRKLAFAAGVALRWAAGDAPPEINPSMFAVFQKSNC